MTGVLSSVVSICSSGEPLVLTRYCALLFLGEVAFSDALGDTLGDKDGVEEDEEEEERDDEAAEDLDGLADRVASLWFRFSLGFAVSWEALAG